ncbi:HAUS augmin-like complex subunit 8 [Menidia menidia]
MASKRSKVPNSSKNTSTEEKRDSSKGTDANKANNSGAGEKKVKSTGTVVKSRYLQAAEKTSLSKSNSLSKDSTIVPLRPSSPKPPAVKPKVGTPPRRSMAPQALAESMMSREIDPAVFGKSILQSTFSDGHCFRPDFDISVIKDKTLQENRSKPERNPDIEKRKVEMQTLLLAFLTAKMESNTTKFKTLAESKILQVMKEEDMLRNELKEKKQRYLVAEKKKMLNDLLHLQIETLERLAAVSQQFTVDYKCFAAAVDTTCHELPVKNFYLNGKGKEFLDKVEVCLKETEKLLQECTQGDHETNSTTLESLQEMKTTTKNISQQLTGTFSELRKLSSLVCHHSVFVQQAAEEEQLGSSKSWEHLCPKE